MKPFNVVALGRFLKENSVESVFASFSYFYHSVSLKYQKKSSLILIDKEYHHHLNKELAVQYKVDGKTVFVPLKNQEEVECSYGEGSILLLPRRVNSSSIIKEAFLYGLPVIGYANSSHDNLLDASSGLKIYYKFEEQAIQDLAENLRLLKYDPEAVKILKKGAAERYEKEFSWGKRQVG